MVALAFDTLTASKALWEAGADQRLAEAIVGIVQRTTEMPDISHLAAKSDVALLRSDLAPLAGAYLRHARLHDAAGRGGVKYAH